jgi:hypothetical protein
MKRYFSPAIAIAVGLLVLFGYFFQNGSLNVVRTIFVQWAVLLSAGAVFVGVLNLFLVHLNKIIHKSEDRFYSLFLLAALLLTITFGFLYGPSDPVMVNIFNAIILPVETSLMAIMAITLIYAAIRLLRRRADLMSFVFLATAVLVMLGAAPTPFFQIPLVADLLRPKVINVLSTSGARGILIGVGLGTLLTGLRVLMGIDRPYGGK